MSEYAGPDMPNLSPDKHPELVEIRPVIVYIGWGVLRLILPAFFTNYSITYYTWRLYKESTVICIIL